MFFIALLAFIAFATFFVVKIVKATKVQANGNVSKNTFAKNEDEDDEDDLYYEHFNPYDLSLRNEICRDS